MKKDIVDRQLGEAKKILQPARDPKPLPDVQAQPNHREWPIDKVGVTNVMWPVKLKDKFEGIQNTVAKFHMYVRLPKTQKGTHMSRFTEVLSEFTDNKEFFDMDTMARKMGPYLLEKMESEYVLIDCEFTYFMEVVAPESGKKSKMPIKCALTVDGGNGSMERYIEVVVPVTTLCPCSKEMSENPHNQRGYITIGARLAGFVWIEELACVAMKEGSCQIYPLLKRPDEKWVMDKAGENPKFVEDVVRDIATVLKADGRILEFNVKCENHESIHPHNAYAEISYIRSLTEMIHAAKTKSHSPK